MSRSYRRVAGWTDHVTPHSKFAKKQANRKVRRTEGVQSGGGYKKVYESYEISDYKFLYFSDEEITRMERHWENYRRNIGWKPFESKVGKNRYKYWMK